MNAGLVEWQTRQPQELMDASPCGFKSRVPHHRRRRRKKGDAWARIQASKPEIALPYFNGRRADL